MSNTQEKSKCCGYEAIQMSSGKIACAHCREFFVADSTESKIREEYLKWEDEYYTRLNGYPIQSIIADWWLNKIQESNKALLTKLRGDVAKIKEITRTETGSFKYDVCYEECEALIDKYFGIII